MQAHVDAEGRLVLPLELAAGFGLGPGATVQFDDGPDGLRLRRPVTHLAKVYVEPTSACNLACRTCIRNVWEEPPGQMAEGTFAHIVDGLRAYSPPPTVFFGGYGEPLSHPHIVDMIAQSKALEARVELITNGTLLTEARTRALIAAGLDVLWVSLDGATPESYADVRLGAALPEVLANVERFRDISRQFPGARRPTIGIVFVAMKRNVADLPALLGLSRRLGVTQLLVTNVLPHTAEMCAEVLYARTLIRNAYHLLPPRPPYLCLPQMDAHESVGAAVNQAVCNDWAIDLSGNDLRTVQDRCPFIESGATAIAWDGSLSPCLPLLHDHTSFLNGLQRFSRRYVIGSVTERSLSDLWNAPEYVAFRERVQAFEFAPCALCDGCSLSRTNEEDCCGNAFPTCGGCLWAQGIIQCP